MADLRFEDIYVEHRLFVLRQCLRLTLDADRAEDLLQDVFVLVLRNLHKFDGRSSVSTWLYRIAVNAFLMQRRKKALPIVVSDFEPTAGPSAYATVLANEILEKMPEQDRTLIVRRVLGGENYKEIASHEKANTMKTRFRRALAKAKAAA